MKVFTLSAPFLKNWSKQFYSITCQVISEIVSIDIGFQNAAWVHMDENKQVLGWSRAEIQKPRPYNPAVFRPLVSLSSSIKKFSSPANGKNYFKTSAGYMYILELSYC